MLIVRSILALVLGFAAFGLVVTLFDLLAVAASGGKAPRSLEEYRQNYASYPALFYLTMMTGWSLAALIGTSIGAMVAVRGKWIHGLLIGGLGMAGTLVNLMLIPHPNWIMLGLVPMPLAIGIGIALFGRRSPPTVSP